MPVLVEGPQVSSAICIAISNEDAHPGSPLLSEGLGNPLFLTSRDSVPEEARSGKCQP